ncbi:hypothetical protein E4K72_17980 [Oxalobacteraceae bacterium OM1]|nr:hypothetical protein E4K72_17980 [Oxalobacteraceae bacterium OM1]
MQFLLMQAAMVVMTMVFFVVMLVFNEMLFTRLEFAPGINWVYLPAGVRLLCTLLFAEAGAIGLLIVSWLVSFFYFFPNDPIRAFMGGLLAAIAPYGVYRFADWRFGVGKSLANLTPGRLLLLAALYAFASPFLHHVWFIFHGDTKEPFSGFLAMFVGDLVGTLIVLYVAKAVLRVARVVALNRGASR